MGVDNVMLPPNTEDTIKFTCFSTLSSNPWSSFLHFWFFFTTCCVQVYM